MPIETGAIGDSEWGDEAYNTVHTVTSQLDTHNKTEKSQKIKIGVQTFLIVICKIIKHAFQL